MTDNDKHAAAFEVAQSAWLNGRLTDGSMLACDDAMCRAYHAEMMRHERPAIREAALREAVQVCEDRMKIFLSPQYATGLPMSSMAERFACGQIRDAILALIGKDKGDE